MTKSKTMKRTHLVTPAAARPYNAGQRLNPVNLVALIVRHNLVAASKHPLVVAVLGESVRLNSSVLTIYEINLEVWHKIMCGAAVQRTQAQRRRPGGAAIATAAR